MHDYFSFYDLDHVLIINLIHGYGSVNYYMTNMRAHNEQFDWRGLSGYYFCKLPCPCHLNYDLWPPHWRETFCIFFCNQNPWAVFCLFGTMSYWREVQLVFVFMYFDYLQLHLWMHYSLFSLLAHVTKSGVATSSHLPTWALLRRFPIFFGNRCWPFSALGRRPLPSWACRPFTSLPFFSNAHARCPWGDRC